MAAFGFLLKDKLGPGPVTENPTVIDATTGNTEEELTTPSDTAGREDWTNETPLRIAIVAEGLYVTGNNVVYEVCKRFCEDNPGSEYAYYHPEEASVESTIATIEQAVTEGYHILVFSWETEAADVIAEAVMETAEMYPEIYYLVPGISADDMGEGYVLPPNVCCISYQEEIAGFMAGVAAVRLGYIKLGFLGSEQSPRVMRYGHGFVQGADYAAGLTGASVEMKYAYANKWYSDAELTDCMAAWYAEGTEVIFSCGAYISYSIAEAATQAGGKLIEVDTDHYLNTDYLYGEGLTLTAVVEELDRAVYGFLEDILREKWEFAAGQYICLGLNSAENMNINYIGLSDFTQFGEGFTRDDYIELIRSLVNGTIQVSDSIGSTPVTTNITVDYLEIIA